jgi:hypothetical protein
MKIVAAILVFAVLAVSRTRAQVVTAQLSLEQEQFLPGETLPVTVRVVNNSGQPLHLGAESNWLRFNVESLDAGDVVMRRGEPPVIGEFNLGSSEMATKHVDLAPYFALAHAGRYRVTATVHIKEWNTDTTSPAKDFDIIDGARIWSLDFGLPVPAGVTNQPPVVRKYILEEANYLKQQLRMYVLVSDQSGERILKVSAVGPMVSFSQPEAQLDRASNLHLIYQSGSRTFLYSVVNPEGNIVEQETYDYLDKRPHLGVNAAGDIVEQGGSRRVNPSEIPGVKEPMDLPQPAPKTN